MAGGADYHNLALDQRIFGQFVLVHVGSLGVVILAVSSKKQTTEQINYIGKNLNFIAVERVSELRPTLTEDPRVISRLFTSRRLANSLSSFNW